MNREDRKLGWALVLVLAVIAVELASAIALTSAHHVSPDASHHEPQQYEPWWGAVVVVARWFTSAALWTAVFTGWLTYSTIGLWRETRRLAEGGEEQSQRMVESIAATNAIAAETKQLVAETVKLVAETSNQLAEMKKTSEATLRLAESADLQARALIAAESARIDFVAIEMVHRVAATTSTGGRVMTPAHWEPIPTFAGSLPNRALPRITVKNTGKGRGTIEAIGIGWQIAEEVTRPSEDVTILRGFNIVVEPGQVSPSWVLDSSASFQIDDESRAALTGDLGNKIWMWGFVRYRDFVDQAWDQGFVIRWSPIIGVEFGGPPQYNFRRKVPEEG